MEPRKRAALAVFNLPDCLSLSRIVAIPCLLSAMSVGAGWLAATIFLIVIATDILDGRIARARGQSSARGNRLDHGADACFVTAVTAYGAYLGLVPLVLPLLIAVAFSQYLLDSRAPARVTLRASRLGRCNGIAYFVLSALIVAVHHVLTDPDWQAALRAFAWILVASTLASIADRATYRKRPPLY